MSNGTHLAYRTPSCSHNNLVFKTETPSPDPVHKLVQAPTEWNGMEWNEPFFYRRHLQHSCIQCHWDLDVSRDPASWNPTDTNCIQLRLRACFELHLAYPSRRRDASRQGSHMNKTPQRRNAWKGRPQTLLHPLPGGILAFFRR